MDNRGTASRTIRAHSFILFHSLFVVVVVIAVCDWLLLLSLCAWWRPNTASQSFVDNHLKFHIWSHILSNHRQFYQIQIINRVQLKSPSFTISTRQTEMQRSTALFGQQQQHVIVFISYACNLVQANHTNFIISNRHRFVFQSNVTFNYLTDWSNIAK